jgi:hypothetical protein
MIGAPPSSPRRSAALLVVGALTGALLAAAGVADRQERRMVPAGAVAVVNGVSIQKTDYERAASAVIEATRKDGAGDPNVEDAKRRALDRLIEEELLVQRGIELGLPERDPQMRVSLSARVLEMAALAGDEGPPDEGALRAFFEEEIDRFRSSARLRVAVLFFSASAGADSSREAEAERRALAARARLDAGEPFASLEASGDPLASAPPDALLPLSKLQDYLGATATSALLGRKEGETTEALRGADGYRIVHIVELRAGARPTFEAVRGEVLAAYRKRKADDRVRDMLARRRAEAEIVIAPSL